jgi:hypothetical protein
MKLKLYSTLTLLLFFVFSITSQTTSEKVIAYTNKMMNKKVDRGECWDLVAFALNDAGAKWKAPLEFGTKVEYLSAPLLPGDIMVFANSEFKYEGGKMAFAQHFAIVYEVKDKNTIVVAHQNFNNVRKVTLLEIPINGLTKGKIEFYRPS